MQLTLQGPVARLYIFAHQLWRSFAGDRDVEEPVRTDLCTLVRTVFVSAPFAIACNLATLGFASYSVYLFAFMLWLNLAQFGAVVILLVVVVSVVAAIIAVMIGTAAVTQAINRSEAASVVAAYYRAKKDRICPLIELRGQS